MVSVSHQTDTESTENSKYCPFGGQKNTETYTSAWWDLFLPGNYFWHNLFTKILDWICAYIHALWCLLHTTRTQVQHNPRDDKISNQTNCPLSQSDEIFHRQIGAYMVPTAFIAVEIAVVRTREVMIHHVRTSLECFSVFLNVGRKLGVVSPTAEKGKPRAEHDKTPHCTYPGCGHDRRLPWRRIGPLVPRLM